MFRLISPESRVPKDHLPRRNKVRIETALRNLSPLFDERRGLVVLETRADHFLRVLEQGSVCTSAD